MTRFPDPDRFGHRQSHYERPACRYVCGRAALWRKPCAAGPDDRGSCRGTSDCSPVLDGERWSCRRPAHSGGPCAQGPLPDGSCSRQRPSCSPVPALRLVRGRLSIAAVILVIALVGLNWWPALSDSVGTGHGSGMFLSDPGPLTHQHHAFTRDGGCVSCHEAYRGGIREWLGAAFQAPSTPVAGCVDCHRFAGPPEAPHNLFVDGSPELSCHSCHTEHKGRQATITHTGDAQCINCHRDSFDSLAAHADFGEDFPHRRAGAVIFDHGRHFDYHFVDRTEHASIAPQNCVSCHQASNPGRRVPAANFETACAGCHESGILDSAKSEFTLLSLPAMRLKEEQLSDFAECGAVEGERFRPAGRGKASSFMVWLLGVPERHADFDRAVCNLVARLEKDGPAVFPPMFQARGMHFDPVLFAGLNLEALRQLGQAWAANERYRPPDFRMPDELGENGWYLDRAGDLKYKPLIHADPVMRAWMEFGTSLGNLRSETSTRDDGMDGLIDSLLAHDSGAGSCMKCHTQTRDEVGRLAINWGFGASPERKHFVFRHERHLRLVDAAGNTLSEASAGCGVCHQQDKEADYRGSVQDPDAERYHSNFRAIGRETCAQCHNDEGVRDDCRLCHIYHDSPAFVGAVKKPVGETNDD